MSRERYLELLREKQNRRQMQAKPLNGEIVQQPSSIEIAEEVTTLNQKKAELTMQSIICTAKQAATVRYFSQFFPEVEGELQEMVRTYAQLGIEQIKDSR